MATTYKDSDVKCPFFREQTKRSISCEGIIDESILKLWFEDKKTKDRHSEIFCCNRYCNCEIYSMLEKKYEE